MAAVSLFWNTNMAALTSCKNTLLSVFTHVADIYANLFEQNKAFSLEKSSTPEGFVWYTNVATISLFRNTNMATVTSCENTL